MESLEEEDEKQEQEQEQDESPKKKKAEKRGPRGLWKQDVVDDLIDYYSTNLIFVNTKNQQNGKQQIEKQGRAQGE